MKKYTYALYGCIFLFMFYFGMLSVMRHHNLYSLRLDLGNMDQTVWNVANGNGFTLTDPSSDVQVSRLAYHADFLLMLFVPLYKIWSHPNVLLITQVVVLAFGALPLYWIAEKKLKSGGLALFLAMLYLLYPPLQRVLMYDFHPVALSVSFLLFAYWYMESRRWWLFTLFATLVAVSKEQLWVTVALMGLYIALGKRAYKLGWSIVGVSLAVFYVLMWHVIPSQTLQNQHFALKYLSDFGGDPTTIISNFLAKPGLVFSTVLSTDRLWYLFALFVPVGFLSLLSPFALLFALPDFAINLLSSNRLMRSIDFQYTSVIIPFIFIAAVNGLAFIARMFQKGRNAKRIRSAILVVVALAAVWSSYYWGVLPYQRMSLWWLYFRQPPGYTTIKSVVQSIPSNATVSVTNNLGAQVSQRQYLYNFPVNAFSADYVLVKLDDRNAWPSLDQQRQVEASLSANPAYELIAREASFSAFRRVIPAKAGIQE